MSDHNPPPQVADPSNPTQNPYSGQQNSQTATFLPTYSASTLPYANYSPWTNLWSSNYSGYATMATNPAMQLNMPYAAYPSQWPTQSNTHVLKTTHQPDSAALSSTAAPPRVDTPPLPDPDTYCHWDDVLKTFLDKTKLTQCRRGLELDILVLHDEWEQRMLPDALKELVFGLQLILDRISGKAKSDTETHADASNSSPVLERRRLEERKLEYIKLTGGRKPESPSSINKSISQFLSRSRARNDLSNRAEFLQTLAEKRQTMAAAHIVDSGSTTVGAKAQEVVSCARVDAKTIDRAKQIKYDIMKNEDGPLMRTASIKHPPSNLDVTTEKVPESSKTSDENPRKRRRLAGSTTSSSKSKSKATQGEPPVRLPQSIQDDTDGVPSALVPALDERIRNIEEHLSVRYVPSPPQMLLTRLKYLEDHLIRLEKEYPPWAALHFKQPARGWPPPPRSTPIIVPPHFRSTSGNRSTNNTETKPRHKNSTLHKAVMERLEIQQAMNEMGIQ